MNKKEMCPPPSELFKHNQSSNEKQQQSINLRINYLCIRGSAQPARNLFYYLNLSFEDKIHEKTKENDKEVGFKIGLPYLEDNDLQIHEVLAIMNYICKKYKRNQLIGQTPQQEAKISQSLMKYNFQRKKINGHILESLIIFKQNQNIQKEVQLFLKKLAQDCKFVDFCLKSLWRGHKYIFEELTIVDFIFYQISFYIYGFYHPYINDKSPFYSIIEYKLRFEQQPFYKNYKQKIERHYLFFEFVKNQEINQIIENNWKGNSIPLIKRIF